MNNQTILKQLSSTLQILLPDMKLLYVFGSQASGKTHSNSDYDLAVLNNLPLNTVNRWGVAQQLASDLGKDVDLIDLSQASPVLRMQVIDTGKLLYGDKNTATAFEMQTFSMYGNLQENRAAIIADFKQQLTQESSNG